MTETTERSLESGLYQGDIEEFNQEISVSKRYFFCKTNVYKDKYTYDL